MFIGITGYNHESSAALVNNNGVLIDYCKEEYLSRIKGDKSFPKRSLERIIKVNNLDIKKIKSIAFYERPMSAFLFPLKTAASYLPDSLPFMSHQLRNFNKSSINCFSDVADLLPGLEKKLIYLDHHLSHTLTALPYSDETQNLCSVVVDGFGDRNTTSISYVTKPLEIKELWDCKYPSSLGLYYSTITDFLGFQINEGEYKVMGLSSFGNENSDLAKKTSNLIWFDKDTNSLKQEMSFFKYHLSPTDSFSDELIELLGEPRNPFKKLLPQDKDFQKYADIAKGAQIATENILCEIFSYAHQLTGCNKFLFSGGVALNSASLRKIANLRFIEKLIVPPSPGDAGSSIGSAYYAYLKDSKTSIQNFNVPSLFPCKSSNDDLFSLSSKILSIHCEKLTNSIDESVELISNLISNGEIIGIVINNAETGPRALGNRSLICDGQNTDSVNILNTVIKNRSPFRPTAPLMKMDVAKRYYKIQKELIDSYYSMGATCLTKENTGAIDFPTTHVDGTARIQILKDNSFYEKLFLELEKNKVLILANSSLNLSGDPTCYDLIDGLLVCARNPLKYLLTDYGLLKYNKK